MAYYEVSFQSVGFLPKNGTFYFVPGDVTVFRAQEPKAPVTYCDHALSGVRPSVRRPLDYLHFRLLLQNRLMDFDETWYG